MQRTIKIKRRLPYPVSQVWRAIAEGDKLGKWFMPNDFEPEMGREFTFRKPPQKGWDGITYCQVTELAPQHSVAYTYRGSASAEKTLACAGVHSDIADNAVKGIFADLDTMLRFTLKPEGNGTCMVLEHSGYKGLKLVIISLVMGMGWKKLIKTKLPGVLAEIAMEAKIVPA